MLACDRHTDGRGLRRALRRELRDGLVEVEARCGLITGQRVRSVDIFRGIRYAEPPVNELRFAPPVPAKRAPGGIDALAFGHISVQDIDPLAEVMPGTEQLFYATGVTPDEDCLNLNVWSPVGADRAPVLVYIHGGGFLCGSGTGPWTDGQAHASKHGLVVVTINYRLGILGGLYLGAYEPVSANLALQDQMLALRWVQENIAAFGGDPQRVTVAGESAGAMSVAALLFAPGARGLFRRAVVQSGHLDGALSVEDASAVTRRVLTELGIAADAPRLLERLRHTSLLRILAVQRRLGVGARLFPLVDDGRVLDGLLGAETTPPWADEVDLLVGTAYEENRLFGLTGWGIEAQSPELLINRLLDHEADRTAALSLYCSQSTREADRAGLSHRILTERAWTEPARRLCMAHVGAAGRTYNYEFAWRSSALGGRVGAAHVVDIPFFFENLDAAGVDELLGERVVEDATRQLAARISSSLAQFVSAGDLADSPLGHWPVFEGERRPTMVIDVEPRVELDRSARSLDFWERHRGSILDLLDGPAAGTQ